MSFAGSLLDRAADAAPVLRPRISARFESSGPLAEGQREVVAPRAAAASPRDVADFDTDTNPMWRPAPSPATEREGRAAAAPAATPATPMTPPSEAAIERIEPIQHTERIERVEHIDHARVERVERVPVIEPHITHLDSRHETTVIHPAPLSTTMPTPPQPERVVNVERAAPLPVASIRVAPPVSDGPPSAQPNIASPPPAAPTIRVTIGRVDVRAVASPSPSQPSTRPRPPAFTIDDYLRLRDGERR